MSTTSPGVGYGQDLPYSDASFDRVLTAFMFHHLDRDVKLLTLREIRRVLRPGGALYLVGFAAESLPATA